MKSFMPEYMGTLPWGTNPVNPQSNQIWFTQDPQDRLFSWYEDHWVEVCPTPPGSDMVTITLPRSVWAAVSKAITIAISKHG